ncbi:MAG TPA: M48 family metalloprotease [Burkholderiaceae bacterium]|nr:M48 family metalloprotease [Burkholderiaceae bacterium]HNB44325.1 M48 family metalloprotease [Burkholderiaceae bacterium]HNG78808.1 M48 family metalloprotease [Burkholderiaceae bacterium]
MVGILSASLLSGGVAPAQEVPPSQAPRPARSALPSLGDAGGEELGVGAERRIGDRIMQELRRDPDLLDDALLVEYVRSIFDPLLQSAKARGDLSPELAQLFAWETFVVRDRSVNAFALPGGFIGVHLGLISMTATRDELASVLAHELSHVTQRHIARSLATNRRNTALGVVAMILGVMAAARSNVDAANALIVGGQAGVAQSQLNFSRDMEREADRVGFGVLEQAGFAGSGMVGMFEHLQQANRLTDYNQFPYLRSHPLSSERIAEARSRLGIDAATTALDLIGSGGAQAQWLHAAMQGRARGLMDARSEVLQRLASATAGGAAPGSAARDDGPQGLATAYAAALAATRLKNWALADKALARAWQLVAPYPAAARVVLQLQVESQLERDRPREAATLLAQAPADGSRAAMLLNARVAVAQPGPAQPLKRVGEDLRTWVALHPNDAAAWMALSIVEARLGAQLASLRAQAEAHFVSGDLTGAADRLRAAQRQARASGGDSYEAAIIDARLRAVEEQRRRERDDPEGRR